MASGSATISRSTKESRGTRRRREPIPLTKKNAREEWYRQRDEWREKRRQWREEWRKKRREFREEMRARYGSDFSEHEPSWRWHADPHHLFRILGILALIAVTIMIFSHIYILFGLIVLAGLYFAYRGGFDHFDYPHMGAPPRPNPPAPPADAPKG